MILVTGATGFVGEKIMRMCKDTVACPSLRNASADEVLRIVEESGETKYIIARLIVALVVGLLAVFLHKLAMILSTSFLA